MKKNLLLKTITLCAIGSTTAFLSKKSNRDKVKKQVGNIVNKISKTASGTNANHKILSCNKKYLWTSENEEVKEILS